MALSATVLFRILIVTATEKLCSVSKPSYTSNNTAPQQNSEKVMFKLKGKAFKVSNLKRLTNVHTSTKLRFFLVVTSGLFTYDCALHLVSDEAVQYSR